MRCCHRCSQRHRWWPEVDAEPVAVSIFGKPPVQHWACPDGELLCVKRVADVR